MWARGLLIALWTVQIPFTALCLVQSVLSLIFSLVQSRYHYITLFTLIAYCLTGSAFLILGLVEIVRYRHGRLQPRFFTISQGTRAVIQSVLFYSALRSYFRWRLYGGPLYFDMVLSALMLLALYTGTIYGCIVVRRYGRFSQGTSATNNIVHGIHRLMTPTAINQSHEMKTESSIVADILRWVYAPILDDQQGRPASLTSAINTAGLVIKYVPGLIVLTPTLVFSPRLPSEPKQQSMREDPNLADWDYIKPRGIAQSQYSDRPRSGPFPDETLPPQDGGGERPLDALSLHTIDEDALAPVLRRSTTLRSETAMPERLLGPRFLCYLDDTQPRGYRTLSTKDWGEANGADGMADYIFVSYTRRQFYTLIVGDPSLPAECNVTLQKAANRDTATLVDFAIRASRAANVSAFWIDYECVQPEGGERAEDSMEDVYRICDIVRSAHSLAIVTGPALLPNYEHDGDEAFTNKADWLHDWGRRLWTVPEALLCPAEHRIAVYAVGSPTPEHVAKRNLASRVWDDAGALRQLVDHYESSLPLTQLELISIALECLQRRQTEKRRNGDVAYALMGLLRQRPRVVKKDSDFQAFARLSLANDSNMLLERLICLKPSTLDAPWHNMRDAWKARLWDIYPLCQVSEVVGRNTIVLGGAQGAVINWSYLHSVDFHATSARSKAWVMVRGTSTAMIVLPSFICFISVMLSFMSAQSSSEVPGEAYLTLYAPIAVMLAFAFCLALWVPALLKQLYSREIQEAQARFFGMEGCPLLEEVEKHIFGQAKDRIKWVLPSNPGQPASAVSRPPPTHTGHARHFTLINTLTLSAVAFEARRPPNVVAACDRERGYVRSVLCSYDASSNTFVKEGVVRMLTSTLDRMPKMDMFRFTVSSTEHEPEVTE